MQRPSAVGSQIVCVSPMGSSLKAQRQGVLRTANVSSWQFYVKGTSQPWSVGLLYGRRRVYLRQRVVATCAVQVEAPYYSAAIVDIVESGQVLDGRAW